MSRSSFKGPVHDRNLTIIDFYFFLFVLVISIVFFIILSLLKNFSESEDEFICFIILGFIILAVISKIIVSYHKNKIQNINNSYSDRKTRIKDYLKRNNVKYLNDFNKPINDNKFLNFFYNKEKISFNDVFVEEINNDTVYIGDLEWSTYETEIEYKSEVENKKYFKGDSGVHYRESKKEIKHEIKHFMTMCVLYDNAFTLPDFQIKLESLKDKILDVLNFSEVKDIDFSSDKAFSDKWLLSSSENEGIVRDFFNQNIRSCFVKIDGNPNYIIGARRNMLYIITIEPVEPDKYRSIAEDLVEIRDFLKANKKYYKGNKSIPNQ